MPGGDGTGPVGMGPMTGRGAGFCAGFVMPGYSNAARGRGFGMGFGFGRGRVGWGGRGRRNWFRATGLTGWQRAGMGYPGFGFVAPPAVPYTGAYGSTMSAEQQIDALKGQAEYFEDALEGIRKRIEQLAAESKKG